MGGKALRHTVECVCLQCGKQFTRKPSDIKNGGGKFCSYECLYESRRNRVDLICEHCGKPFRIKKSTLIYNSGKYCSPQCYNATRPLIKTTCPVCNKPIDVRPSKLKRHSVYCCKKCASIGRGIKRRGEQHPMWLGGHSGYRGANWEEQSRLAYERDGGVCQICHKKQPKNKPRYGVHHIRPFRYFEGDYIKANELSNLITLCPVCHGKADRGVIYVPLPLL